jgi:hypothetical protein
VQFRIRGLSRYYSTVVAVVQTAEVVVRWRDRGVVKEGSDIITYRGWV